jgi:hypothetical protein
MNSPKPDSSVFLLLFFGQGKSSQVMSFAQQSLIIIGLFSSLKALFEQTQRTIDKPVRSRPGDEM